MIKIILALSFLFFSNGNSFAQTTAQEISGKALYLSNGCAQCHGSEGKGDGVDAEGYDPFPTNFHKIKDYRHGSKKEDIIHSIKYGVKDNENSIMPPFAHLTDQELDQISSFLLSLQEKNEN